MYRKRLAVLLIAILTAGGALWPSAAQASVIEAQKCVGEELVRCGQFRYEAELGRMRGFALIRDAAGGSNWNVAVNNVRVQIRYSTSAPWETLITEGDYDGWHALYDNALTAYAWCDNRYHRVVFNWSADRAPIDGSTDSSGSEVSNVFYC